METNYDVHYFIRKFEKIPESMIIEGAMYDSEGRKCFNGWCGVLSCDQPTKESAALKEVLSVLPCTWYGHGKTEITTTWDHQGYSVKAVYINNGWTNEYRQPTPKARILAALYDIRDMQRKEHRPDITQSLAVLPVEERLDVAQAGKVKEVWNG